MDSSVTSRHRILVHCPTLAVVFLFSVLLARPAVGDPLWIVTHAPPTFAARIPDGYRSVHTPAGTDVMAMFSHRDAPSSVLLLFVRAGDPFPQRPLEFATRRVLRRADPFPFQDRVETFRVLSFTVEGLRGEAIVNGHSIVRFAVPVPVADAGLVVTVLGPAESEPEMRRLLVSVLDSLRARTHWLTPVQRVLLSIGSAGFLVGLVLSLLYAAFALVVFRRFDRWHIVRGLVLAAAGMGWLGMSIWALSRTAITTRVTGALIGSFGLVLLARGAGKIHRARSRSREKKPSDTGTDINAH